MDGRVRLRHWKLTAVVAVVVLGSPPGAHAHIRSGVVATDYRASVSDVPSVVASAVSVRVDPSDRALALTVSRGSVVSALSPSGASMVRIDDRLGSGSRNVMWHDARLRGLPVGVQRGRWVVPLVVDGTRTRIQGEIWRVRAPAPWPWLLAGVPFVVALAPLLRGSRRRLSTACVVFAGIAVIATVAIAGSFAASRSASTGRMLEGFDELAFAGVGVLFLVRGPHEPRVIAAVGLGLLAVFAGGLKLAVLAHGVVLSALPVAAVRSSVVLALWSGLAAILAGAWLLATSPRSSLAPGRHTPP